MKFYSFGDKKAVNKLFWLHGLGAGNFEEAISIYQMLSLSKWEFIFPIAPLRPVAWSGGATLNAWFNMGLTGEVESSDLDHSVEKVIALVKEHTALGEKGKVVLAGFSQGAALSIACLIKGVFNFDRVFALSGWLANKHLNRSFAGEDLWMGHGTSDSVIPLSLGKASAEYLRKLGAKVNLHVYPMGHEICLEEIADIRALLV